MNMYFYVLFIIVDVCLSLCHGFAFLFVPAAVPGGFFGAGNRVGVGHGLAAHAGGNDVAWRDGDEVRW